MILFGTFSFESFKVFYFAESKSRGLELKIDFHVSRRNVVGKIGRAIGWAYDVSGGGGRGGWERREMENDGG